MSIIDEIVSLIKSKTNSALACAALMEVYNFTERQAKAILDLKLNRLVNMEILKIEEERDKLKENIEYYNKILNDKKEFLTIIEKNLRMVSEKYGDNRRTIVENINEEAPVVEEKVIITYFSNFA